MFQSVIMMKKIVINITQNGTNSNALLLVVVDAKSKISTQHIFGIVIGEFQDTSMKMRE